MSGAADSAVPPRGWQPPALATIPEAAPATAPGGADDAAGGSRDPHEETREEAYQAGFSQGFEEGRAQAQALAAQMQSLLGALAAPFAETDAALMRELLALTERVCGAVLHRELATDSETIRAVLAEALDALGESHTAVEVTLNPADAVLCRELGVLADGEISMREDPRLQRGGLLLRSGSELIDARTEVRLQAILESLYAQAGLPEPARDADDESRDGD